MNYFKLLLLLNGALSVSGTCFSAAAAEEGKEETLGLDEAVLVSEGELKNRTFSYGKEEIEFSPELYQLSGFMKRAAEDKSEVKINLEDGESYLKTIDASLQEIHNLLIAVSQDTLAAYLDHLSMNKLLKTVELANYLSITKEGQDITDTIVKYIVIKTIQAPKTPELSLASKIRAPKLNQDLEKMLIKNFETRSELFEAGSVLRGHTAPIFRVAWRPDGKQLACALADGTIKIWDVIAGEVLQTLNEHEYDLISIAWSPDGKELASGSADTTIKIWNPATGELLHTLKGHNRPIISVVWSPNGKKVASSSVDTTIKIWNPTTGELLHTLNNDNKLAVNVAWSLDGRELVSESGDTTIKIWNSATGEVLSSLSDHSRTVRRAEWSPDGRQFASVSWDNSIKIWNPTGQVLSTLRGHTAIVSSVAWSADGRQLASGSVDNTIRLWSVPNTQKLLDKMYSMAEQDSQLEREQRAQATAKSLKEEGAPIAPTKKKKRLKQESSKRKSAAVAEDLRNKKRLKQESAAAAAVSQEASDDSDSSDHQLVRATENSLKEQVAPVVPRAAVEQEAQAAFPAASDRSIYEEPAAASDDVPVAPGRPPFHDTLMPAYDDFYDHDLEQALHNSGRENRKQRESAAAAAVSQEASDYSDSSDAQLAKAIANSLKEQVAPVAPRAAVEQEAQAAVAAPLSQEQVRAARMKKFGYLEKRRA